MPGLIRAGAVNPPVKHAKPVGRASAPAFGAQLHRWHRKVGCALRTGENFLRHVPMGLRPTHHL